ncbi:MAG: response regulator transcription factor [Ardenticatenaceae bacterium]|nr:response regulator transcription factor [Ardenticatenaceae bacterium]
MAVIAGEERPEGRPPPTDGPPLLLLADEELIHHESLSQQLEQRGFRVTRARSGPRALMVARATRPAVLVLAPDLPGLNGWAVRYALRSEGNRAPILMLGRRADAPPAPNLRAPDLDGYLPKPFSLRALLTQIEALYRYAKTRAATERSTSLLTIGAISLDPDARRAFRNGVELELTPKAFEILKLLMENAGLVVLRRLIIEQVWETDWLDDTRTLDAHIRWLRRQIEPNPERPRYIYTVRGVGYRFAAPDEATTPYEWDDNEWGK